jgi:predicted flap endonuclease-1-like 5' DNA nuclease
MANRKTGAFESDLPRGMGNPARQALAATGYTRLDQLRNIPDADLLKIHGVGPKAVRVLREALAAQDARQPRQRTGKR